MMMTKKVLTPLEIYKQLEQSNCKRCMLPSCLAFAAAVIGGQKKLEDCPLLPQISGRWISFRELKGGIDWRGLFGSRCEMPLRRLADGHPELLADIVDLFMGQEVTGFDADIALVLHPFPHIPVLICYQAPDGDLGSQLNIFFDECCSENLHVKSLYTLCAGLVMMFEKIAVNHY